MRIVLDTNVIIFALIFDTNPEKLLSYVLVHEHQLISSSYIINETMRILRTKFKTKPTSLKLFQEITIDAEMIYFDPYLHVLKDEPDNRVLETALSGQADLIVTGDKLLLELKKYKNIKIVTINDCLKLLQ